MVSYAIVYRHGLEKYVDDAASRGLAGLIVPDLPVEESAQLAAICGKRDISLIQLVTPTTPRERAVRIAETSTGFLYYVSVAGITGERTELPPELVDNVGWLRTQTELPICIGFGISKPEHVRAARAGGRWPNRRLGNRAPNRDCGRETARPGPSRSRRLRGRTAGCVECSWARREALRSEFLRDPATLCSLSPAGQAARRRSRSTSSPAGTARCGASPRRSETAARCRSIR